MNQGIDRAIMTGTLLSTPDYSNGDAFVEMLSTDFVKKGDQYEKIEQKHLLKIPQWFSKKQLSEGCYVLIDSSMRQDKTPLDNGKFEYGEPYLYVNHIKILDGQEREDESSVNIGILYGRLSDDPSIQYSQIGNPFVRVSLVSNHSEKLEDNTWKNDVPDFNRVSIFGNQAEFIDKWCKKGMELVCEGRVKTDFYKEKRFMSLIAQTVQIGGSKADNEKFSNERVTPKLPKSSPPTKPAEPAEPQTATSPPSMPDDFEDDIPF